MQLINQILKNKTGVFSIINIVVGLIIATVAGNLAESSKMTDIVVIIGTIISFAGTNMLIKLIVEIRNQNTEE